MVKDMDESQDAGGSAFEERIRDLFQSGASRRGLSATSVMHGARRRRVRHRATAAGASFAVLGVAAGAVAFAGHAVGPARAIGVEGAVTSPAVTPPATRTPAAPASTASTSPTSAAETCSASVSGTVPPLTPTTADGLDFEKLSGNSAGAVWTTQIHTFPTWQNWLDWRRKQPAPPGPGSETNLQGPPALVQTSGNIQLVIQQADHYFFGFSAHGISGAVVNGAPTKAFVLYSWIQPGVDHLCLQFAHHAEFEPVYRIQGGSFAVFSYTAADEPLDAIGYDAAGHELGRANGEYGLRPPTVK